MGLDVYLTMPSTASHVLACQAAYRQCCGKHEPSGDDPGGPCIFCDRCDSWVRPHLFERETCPIPDEVFSSNITHNLNGMAEEAGIYKHLWRPEELGIVKARELIEPLNMGLALMRADPPRFEKFNAPNGWGLYKHFLPWVAAYARACAEYPDADVKVSR